jgi:fructose-1,6-bisphosphatase/inositol monophosphatase family enzyme
LTLSLDIPAIRGWIAEAADIALGYFGRSEVEWKGIADPVTQADREIEQLLTRRIRDAYPQHGILGEEYGAADDDREYLWTIDPIDGTRAYVEGLPTWSITIALLRDRQPVFGLVHMPLYDDWTYTDGDDVICNGRISNGQLLTQWEVDSYLFWRSDAGARFELPFTRIMAFGSTATHVAYTARGASIATLTHDSFLWDIAAGVVFMAKLGGEVRYLDGTLLDLAAIRLTQPIAGLYAFGHPDVNRRLLALIRERQAHVEHPAW